MPDTCGSGAAAGDGGGGGGGRLHVTAPSTHKPANSRSKLEPALKCSAGRSAPASSAALNGPPDGFETAVRALQDQKA